MYLWTICCVLSVMSMSVVANLQSWSQQTYPNEKFTLYCNDTLENYTITNDDKGVWRKLGKDGNLTTDAHYELSNNSLALLIRNVTDQTAGIYLCDVIDNNDDIVARAVRGINIDGHLFDDILKEYKTNIIRGVITTAAIFVLVVGVCLVDRFQYQSDEQKQKRMTRELERRKRIRQSEPEGKDNPAMVDDLGNNDHKSYGSVKSGEGTTHF